MINDPGKKIGLISVRPKVFIDGEEHLELGNDLLELTVEESNNGDFRCEAVFQNWASEDGVDGFTYFDRRTLDFGQSFSVRAGAKPPGLEIFSGHITALEARYPASKPPTIVVLAENRLRELRKTHRTRTFHDIADSDLLNQIAGEHGLAAEIDIDGPVHRVLAQVNRSDLDFLRERARAIDAEIWVEGDTLHAQSRARRSDGDLILVHGEKLRRFSVLADLADQSTTLTVSGWDGNAKETVEIEASEAAIQAELNGGQGGGSALDDAFGPRSLALSDLNPNSQGEAQALAESEYRQRARRFLTGSGLCDGLPQLRVGTHLTLQGLGELFDGEYYTTQVRHSFTNEAGFLTHFFVERPGLGKE